MASYESRPREFLYVDTQRVKSFLAHMEGGLVEQTKAGHTDNVKADAQAKLLGFGGGGGYSHDWKREEQKSLQDVVFSLFEDSADENGFITDATDDYYDAAKWADGSVQAELEPAQIIRITCEVQMLDGGLFESRLERYLGMVDSLARLSTNSAEVKPVKGTSVAKQKAQLLQDARTSLVGDVGEEGIKAMYNFVHSFLGDDIAMKALPCGEKHLEFGFSGSLLNRNDYIQEEREHLFSRYGTYMSNWTSVLQIASVPEQDERTKPEGGMNFILPSGNISRAATERGAASLLGDMERIGLLDGPRWPTVSVTPLGIYRDVPKAKNSN
ncbi:DUF6414 family protein [Paenarthrobacter sp. 2TAF44]|uniref:DUF6414 family protein n=1 Tax=Paenarthrobacter sp. 2TAF44 TaxID=3233018 RepID=UPI003F985025